MKSFTRLRLGLCHLNKHKFKYNFQDFANPLWSCSLEIESLSHFFLHCHYFTNIRATLLDDLKSVDINIPSFSDKKLMTFSFMEVLTLTLIRTTRFLSFSISFIIKSERFSGSLFKRKWKYFDYKTSNLHFYLITQFYILIVVLLQPLALIPSTKPLKLF